MNTAQRLSRLWRRNAYWQGTEESGFAIVIPRGFATDFASIPRLFQVAFPPYHDDYGKAAVVHDYLYRTQSLATRVVADAIFREAMAVLGCPAWKRLLLYYAVRLGGWAPWNNRRDTLGAA